MSVILRCSMEGGGMMTTVVVTHSERDRRSVKIKLSERGLDLCRQLADMKACHRGADRSRRLVLAPGHEQSGKIEVVE